MRNPDKTPRKAYCTGCGVTFPKRHLLLNHRGTARCGGRFLPPEEFAHLMSLRRTREELDRELRRIRSAAKAA